MARQLELITRILQSSKLDLAVAAWEIMLMKSLNDAEMLLVLQKLTMDIHTLLPNKETWLTQAATQGKYDICEYLLKQGADPNLCNGFEEPPLISAAKGGSLRLVDMLIHYGANPLKRDKQDQTPLMWAASAGAPSLVQRFVSLGNNMDDGNKYGHTAIIRASQSPNLETVKCLLDMGCDIQGALKAFIIRRRYEALQLLLEYGANPNEVCSKSGGTPFQFAACEGDLRIIKLLLQYGADPHVTGNDGETALMCAAEFGHGSVIDILLSQQVDLSLCDVEGKTAVDYAQKQGQTYIKRKLMLQGGRKGNDRIVYFQPYRTPQKSQPRI
ncbi:ankyrin repeat domain-containing protein [Paenibacillus agricola]|uniref:Ankyrin repeat protein n=1 Tax=Paenibacillus agricola TaxID=2716264 RepID=A0ABX0JD34_9BACL|nr:ankyrin repeat domain-containing protein [Paenibacillus agricola]NHN34385.1 hypothetical protein [Paenibacillus agricola]